MGILVGKAVVVTGGGRGIGRGHCLHLGENGASVVECPTSVTVPSGSIRTTRPRTRGSLGVAGRGKPSMTPRSGGPG